VNNNKGGTAKYPPFCLTTKTNIYKTKPIIYLKGIFFI